MSKRGNECTYASGADDSEGSLRDWIASSSDEDTAPPRAATDPQVVAAELVAQFPYDRKLLQVESAAGPRRSRRKRKPVQRYVDKDMRKLMVDDAEADEYAAACAASDSEGERGGASDEDYDADADLDSEDDEEDDKGDP